MEHYLLVARSVTHAQRMQQLLQELGVRGTILRAPAEVNKKGCGYAVRLSPESMGVAREALAATKVPPIHIYVKTEQGYREVEL